MRFFWSIHTRSNQKEGSRWSDKFIILNRNSLVLIQIFSFLTQISRCQCRIPQFYSRTSLNHAARLCNCSYLEYGSSDQLCDMKKSISPMLQLSDSSYVDASVPSVFVSKSKLMLRQGILLSFLRASFRILASLSPDSDIRDATNTPSFTCWLRDSQPQNCSFCHSSCTFGTCNQREIYQSPACIHKEGSVYVRSKSQPWL